MRSYVSTNKAHHGRIFLSDIWRQNYPLTTLLCPFSDYQSNMNTSISQITDLVAEITSHLQNPNSDINNLDYCDSLISKLNRSVNLTENDDSRVRVLDTALSLMCFKAPQVYDCLVEYNVKTIVTVLSSSIACKVIRFGKDEILHIGSSISSSDCVELVEACAHVIGKLESNRGLCHSLVYAVVRFLISVSCYQHMFPLTLIYDVKSTNARSVATLKLLDCFRKEISSTKDEIPLRLQLWYLDPLTLKHDISKVLQDYTKRPFLNLNKEFHERTNWRSIITGLAVSPTMFVETRSLLHNWFLATGRASVLRLLIALVSVILDVITRPNWWGMSLEMGSKLLFSNAYFPNKHHFLRILDGPLLLENFLRVVDIVSRHSDTDIKQPERETSIIDHKSYWALAMNFPEWFYYASSLVFAQKSSQDDYNSDSTSSKACEVSFSVSLAAARYIAFILSPHSQSNKDLLYEFLIKMSESLKQLRTKPLGRETIRNRKKLKKPKVQDKEDLVLKEIDCETIHYWLKDFQGHYDSTFSTRHSHLVLTLQHNLLYRRIPLGILIGCSNGINEKGCVLLLHYAVTGTILTNLHSKNENDTLLTREECNEKSALAGACFIFNLTDIIEKMSTSMFEFEEAAVDFICRVKLRMGKYLTSCIYTLVEARVSVDDEAQMIIDLCSRLVHWRHQGRDCFEGKFDLDNVINALNIKLSSVLSDFIQE